MTRCPRCRTLIGDDATVCPACGAGSWTPPPAGVAPPAEPEGGATVFRDTGGRLGSPTTGEVIVLPPTTAPGGATRRNGWLLALAVIGGSAIVALAVLVTVAVRKAPRPPTSTAPTAVAAPISDIRITSPASGARFDGTFPLVMKVAVTGDEARVKQLDVLVDGQPVAVKKDANQNLIVAVPEGRHSVVARATYDGGELASGPITVERTGSSSGPVSPSTAPRPGTCGELCFHPTAPDVFQRFEPNLNAGAAAARAGATVRVACQLPGGAYDNGAWWDRLDNGFYVADGYLDTPKPAPAPGIPRC